MAATNPDVRFLTARATVQVLSEAELSSEIATAAWMPKVTDGEPTKLQVTAWLAHEGINSNRLAFRAEDLKPAADKIAPPNLLPMDWNHSAVVDQYDYESGTWAPKAIGVWYAAEAKWNPDAKEGKGAMGIEAKGMVWAWAFPKQSTEMLAMQQANGYVEFSMACIPEATQSAQNEQGAYEIAIGPVFFTLSALTVSAADKDAVGMVDIHGNKLPEEEEYKKVALRLMAASALAEAEDHAQALETQVVWEMAKGTEKKTNFPTQGDNKAVSLRSSQWKLFPVNEAQDLKDNWPEIWKRGGNVRGNDQFRRLAPVARRGGKATTASEEYAVRLREAWVARHYEDFQLAGVVAQVKWLAVGSRGLDHMRSVLNEAKDRVKARRAELNTEEHMSETVDKTQVALEAALEANAVLRAELEKAQERVQALEGEAAVASANHAVVVARADEAELKRDALTTELAQAGAELERLASELATAQAKVQEFEAAQAKVEQDTRWGQRFAELPESYQAAFARRSEDEQGRFVQRWAAASDEQWTEFKSDLLVGFGEMKLSYLQMSKIEGSLPASGLADGLSERIVSLIK